MNLPDRVSLADLDITADAQPRAGGLNPDHIADMVASLAGGADLPPVVVYRPADGSAFFLSEGFHRAAAYTDAGRDDLPAVIRAGSREDAILNGMASNQGHGLKRTNADKRRAVEVVLGLHPEWSNRRVADHVGVDDKTVSSLRPEATAELPQLPTKRVGKDGKERAVPSSAKAAERRRAEREDTLSKIEIEASSSGVPCTVNSTGDRYPAKSKRGDFPHGANDPTDSLPVEVPLDDADDDPAAATPAEHPADVFTGRVNRLCTAIDRFKAEVKGLSDSPFARHVHADSVTHALESARKALWQSRPTEPCPYCPPDAPADACKGCRGTGRITASQVLRKAGAR